MVHGLHDGGDDDYKLLSFTVPFDRDFSQKTTYRTVEDLVYDEMINIQLTFCTCFIHLTPWDY